MFPGRSLQNLPTLTKKMEECSEVGLHSLNCAFIQGKRAPLPLGVEEK